MINTTVILAIKIVITIYLSNYLTGSTCSAAESASSSNWFNELDRNYSKYCNCNSGTARISILPVGASQCRIALNNGTLMGKGVHTVSIVENALIAPCDYRNSDSDPWTVGYSEVDGVCTGLITLKSGDYKTIKVYTSPC